MHPLCSCSEATLAELQQLVVSNGSEVRTLAVFAIPERGDAAGAQTAWKDSPVVRHARSIDGVSVVFDMGGIETKRFGAVTSGFVAAYGAGGELRFSGGITKGRGLVGESAALLSLQSAIRHTEMEARIWRVFGCSIRNEVGQNR
jgi:hypothetical protein